MPVNVMPGVRRQSLLMLSAVAVEEYPDAHSKATQQAAALRVIEYFLSHFLDTLWLASKPACKCYGHCGLAGI